MESAPPSAASRWLKAIIVVLAIPVIAFAIATAVPAKYQSDLIDAIQAEVGRSLTAEEVASIDVAAICQDPEFRGDAACGDIALATLTKTVAILGIVIGIALLALVWFLGARAKRDREALISLFRPGLYLTLGGLVANVAIDGLLAVSGVYLAIGVFAGRTYPVVLLLIGIGALLGVVAIVRAAIGTTKKAVSEVIGKRLDPTAEPRLHAVVGELAKSVGTTPPDHVIVGMDPNFYVTEVDVQTPGGLYSGRSLYLSLPLSRILSQNELKAILGHEMGHFRGADTEFSQRFYPIYAGAAGAIQGLASAGAGSLARTLAIYPAAVVLGLFLEGFAMKERAISRDRELAADQAARDVASPADLGSSLVKLVAFSGAWGTTITSLVGAMRASKPMPNPSETFVGFVRVAAEGDPLANLDAKEIPHPTDSHPPLSERLAGLGVALESVRTAALDVTPTPSAADLIVDAGAIEFALSAEIRDRLARIIHLLPPIEGPEPPMPMPGSPPATGG